MQMEEKLKVNEVTLLNVLPACLEESQLLSLKELHACSLRHGFQDDELVVNAFIAAYAKCGSLSYAENVFHGMKTKSASSWNALIGGYVQNGFPGEAFDLYLLMRDSGLDHEFDCFAIANLLLACGHLKFLCYGKEIHSYMLRNGLEMDEFICTSLLSLYIHCEKILTAKLFFDRTKDKSLVGWNTVITGFSQNGLPIEALDTFREMLSSGNQPNVIAITGVLGACSHLTKEKDEASWNVIITGYGLHGNGQKAIELFELMQSSGCRPDSFTFMGVLTACSHAGLVTEGLKYFSQMQSFYDRAKVRAFSVALAD
ncbi:hypothetical protein L6164_011293 [Bauhinia variegata]|uniref:Uncharacterized protein n=1 Tax=Bauhinia variegata TaxID=167791 RepID=A0ACB9P6N4_BAUVA|nr:hypothetical protein L6164_011293 [Bauhinia variegata]